MTSLHEKISKILNDEHNKIEQEQEKQKEHNDNLMISAYTENTISYAQSHFQEIYN